MLVLIIVTENQRKAGCLGSLTPQSIVHLHPPAAPPTVRTLKSSSVRG